MPVIEIRTYRLKPGSRERFHALVSQESLPLMQAWGTDVVRLGPSLHDADGYVLIRAYRDMSHLSTEQAAFYGSPAWRQGPREAIVSLIEADLDAVMAMTPEQIEALRDGSAGLLDE